MCVAIYLPATAVIDEETLKKCYTRNKDSIGYCFVKAGKVCIRKFLAYDEFIAKYRLDKAANPDEDFIIHFRIATSGKIDLANCHPFKVTEKVAMVHNGILASCLFKGNVKESDTNQFCQSLAPLLEIPKNWNNMFFWRMVQETISTGNKMIFMRNDGEVKIVNENAGTWRGGIWFSNMHWDYTPPAKIDYSAYPGYNSDGQWQGYVTPRSYSGDWPGLPAKQTSNRWHKFFNVKKMCLKCAQMRKVDKDYMCFECWSDAKSKKELQDDVRSGVIVYTDFKPQWTLAFNLQDLAFFTNQSFITQQGDRKIFKYGGEAHVVLVRENVESCDINDIEGWIERTRQPIDYTPVKAITQEGQ